MSAAPTIIKRLPGVNEPYDERKLYASIYSSCLTVSSHSGEAEVTADRVCRDIEPWLAPKHEITSKDIRHEAAKYLKLYNPDAAYIYLHHRIIG
ncbi:MAG TPA: hypothetical protein VLA77_01265 [Candidatus Saccharimonadales bacterium]|nr:hypothetical protein [Candidatus Saccharimonadales bacterium]